VGNEKGRGNFRCEKRKEQVQTGGVDKNKAIKIDFKKPMHFVKRGRQKERLLLLRPRTLKRGYAEIKHTFQEYACLTEACGVKKFGEVVQKVVQDILEERTLIIREDFLFSKMPRGGGGKDSYTVI